MQVRGYVFTLMHLRRKGLTTYDLLMEARSFCVVDDHDDDTETTTMSEIGDFPDMLEDFIQAKRAKGVKPLTIRLYQTSNVKFFNFLKDHGHPTNVADITEDHIREFFIRRRQDVSGNTVELEWRQMRTFFNWLYREGEITRAPSNIEPPTPTRSSKSSKVIPPDRVTAILATCDSNSLEDRRDTAIIRVWWETGLRKGEMHSIRLDGLNLEEGSITTHGKMGDKVVYFGDKTAEALRRYLRARKKSRHAGSNYLWLSIKGRMSYDGLREMLDQRTRKAGVPHINPHMFRHTLRHQWAMGEGSDDTLKTQAGWNTDKMLGIYGEDMKRIRAKEAVQRLRLGDQI